MKGKKRKILFKVMELLKRWEVEKMSEQEVKNLALEKVEHKGFNSYIVKDFNGSYEELNCMTFYNGMHIEYITYPDYVARIKGLENYVEYVKRCLQEKCFNSDELSTITDYKDYRNKTNFLYNIYYQIVGGKTIYSDSIDRKIYKYEYSIFLFKNESDVAKFKELNDKINFKFDEKMKDKAFFKSVVKSEMFNHESPICWDGYTPALESLGIDYNKLSSEFKMLVNEAFSEVRKAIEW